MSATANPCAKCSHATRPLPTDWSALDFFDRMVVEQHAALRASCDAAPDAEKPCLSAAIDRAVEPALSGRSTGAQLPAPAAATTAPTLADFANWLHDTQLGELKSMNETLGGTAYSAHLNGFIDACAASRALRQFNSEPRTSTTTPATSANKKA